MKNKIVSMALAALMLLSCTGCGADSSDGPGPNSAAEETFTTSAPIVQPDSGETDVEALVEAGLFSNRDFRTEYDAFSAVEIELGDSGIKCSSPAVKVEGNTVTLSLEGTYVLSGSISDGMVIIDAANTDKIQLVLNNASITSQTSAPLYIKQADKVFLTLAENSENELINGGSFDTIDDSNIDAVIFARDDLTINGIGSLTVSSPAGHGIAGNDSLSITGGAFDISCASNALKANDDITIAGGDFVVSSGKDAMQCEHDSNPDKGFIYIAGGNYNITAEGDGISAGTYLQIDGGSFDVLTGGGYENAAEQRSEMWGQFAPGMRPGRGMGRGFGGGRPGGMNPPQMPENVPAPDMESFEMPEMPQPGFVEESQNSSGDGSSMKAFKAKGELTINGGSFVINSADDAFHSDLNMSINAGEFEISAGDDAFHAEENLIINSGIINISHSYEGMEALHVYIFNGLITITATDDGLNAAGGNDASGFGGRDRLFGGAMNQSSGGSISIAGGNLSIMAYGDGIDANGSIEISGGSTTVCGPSFGDTAIIDYCGTAVISGGTFIGSGSSAMSQEFGEGSQKVISSRANQSFPAGTEVEVCDSEGKRVINFAPALDFTMVMISTPELNMEANYSISVLAEN